MIKCFELLRFRFSLTFLPRCTQTCNLLSKIDCYRVGNLCVFGSTCRLGRTDTYSRSKNRPFSKISRWPVVDINRIHRAIETTGRRRIRQMISRRSIAHVPEFISRTRHGSILKISSQSSALSHFLSPPSSRYKPISFSFFPITFIFLSLFSKNHIMTQSDSLQRISFHGKNDFAHISKNLTGYRSANN